MFTLPARRPPLPALALLLLLLGALGGCGPADPLDRPITAATPAAYRHWQYRHLTRLDAREQREFGEARQQILLDLQLRETGRSPAEFQDRLLALLHTRTAREVIAEGYRIRLVRLLADNQGDDLLLTLNEARVVAPTMPAESAAYLASQMTRIKTRQLERDREIAAIESRLAELGFPTDPLPAAAPASPRPTLRGGEPPTSL